MTTTTDDPLSGMMTEEYGRVLERHGIRRSGGGALQVLLNRGDVDGLKEKRNSFEKFAAEFGLPEEVKAERIRAKFSPIALAKERVEKARQEMRLLGASEDEIERLTATMIFSMQDAFKRKGK